MKRISVFIVGLTMALTLGVRSADAASILYFSDFQVGTDRMAQALTALAGTHTTTTATSVTDFTTKLTGGGFQLAIFFQQNFPNSAEYDAAFAAIAAFLTSGGAAIADDWTQTPGHIAPFGASFTGINNNPTVTVTAPALLTGIVNPVTHSNPGWGIWTTGMTAIAGATCGATFSNGDCAIIVRNGGRSFFNGFLNDTFADGAEGVQLYINEITAALEAQAAIPEPGTWLLLGTGLLIGYRKLRTRKA